MKNKSLLSWILLPAAVLETFIEAQAEQVHIFLELINGGFLEITMDFEDSPFLMDEVDVGDLPLVIEDIVSQLAYVLLGK